jgi:hypothetical protein
MELLFNKYSGRVKPMPNNPADLNGENQIEQELETLLNQLMQIVQDQTIPIEQRRQIIAGFNEVVARHAQETGEIYPVPLSLNI